jgi:hypothetical protein
MAVIVSEYGKVLGLVTMDDLLAQIFGVLRDERAALQQSMPNMRVGRARTPVAGVSVEPGTGPIPKEDGARPDTATGSDAIDPPPIEPIHTTDEVTPPAIDVEDLQSQSGRPSDGKRN